MPNVELEGKARQSIENSCLGSCACFSNLGRSRGGVKLFFLAIYHTVPANPAWSVFNSTFSILCAANSILVGRLLDGMENTF